MLPPNTVTCPTETLRSEAAEYLASRITGLAETAVPWALFLSGGSAVELVRAALERLPADTQLDSCTVRLIDERWGSAGHPNSNETALKAAGMLSFLSEHGADWRGMLPEHTSSPTDHAAQIGSEYDQILKRVSRSLLLAGMGPDGHTAGLLPVCESPLREQLFESTESSVLYYNVPETVLRTEFPERITATPHFLAKLQEVLLFAQGSAKQTAIQQFLAEIDLNNQLQNCQTPARFLRLTSLPVILFTDQTIVSA